MKHTNSNTPTRDLTYYVNKWNERYQKNGNEDYPFFVWMTGLPCGTDYRPARFDREKIAVYSQIGKNIGLKTGPYNVANCLRDMYEDGFSPREIEAIFNRAFKELGLYQK